jgi:Flp pilus assembly pilin Flp
MTAFPPAPAGRRRRKERGMFATALRRVDSEEEGQGTIEYVLVMLAVAAVAVVLITWARSGAGKAGLEGLFNNVLSWITAAASRFR